MNSRHGHEVNRLAGIRSNLPAFITMIAVCVAQACFRALIAARFSATIAADNNGLRAWSS